jgi:glycosyltransferase involved in cell wall biosynthesis
VKLTLVIPAYNEAQRIERTLRAYSEALGTRAEIVVVPNHCSDDTANIARRVAQERAGITVLEIKERVGKGGAVRAGFRQAHGEYVGFADADLATPADELVRIAEAAFQGDGAIGSRWARGSAVSGRTFGRSLASRVFASLARSLLALPFEDTQCGVKIFHRRFLDHYLAASRVNDLAFDVEMLLLLHDAGARIQEVPSVWIAQPGSSTLGTLPSFVSQGRRMAVSIVKLWWQRHPYRTRGARPTPQL